MKRTNEKHQEVFLVSGANSALANAANISGNGSFVNIANGQLGVIAATNEQAHLQAGAFLTATNDPAGTGVNTPAHVPAIRVVQGTPSSADTSANYGWFNEHPNYVRSGIIRAGKVKSFTANSYALPILSAEMLSGVTDAAIQNDSEYSVSVEFRSERNDTTFGANVERIAANFITPDYTANPVDTRLDDVITQLGSKLNLYSVLNTSPARRGNRLLAAIALNTVNGLGTPIGDVELNDDIVISRNGNRDITLRVTRAILNTFHEWIDAGLVAATDTIEVLDPATSGNGRSAQATVTMTNVANLEDDTITVNGTAFVEGTDWARGAAVGNAAANFAAAVNAANIGITAVADAAVVTLTAGPNFSGTAGNALTLTYTDANPASVGATLSGATFAGGTNSNKNRLIVMGLPRQRAAAYDNVAGTLTRVDVEFGDAFQSIPGLAKAELSGSFEGYGSGTLLKIRYDKRAFGFTGTEIRAGHSDQLVLAPNYIDENQAYNVFTIDYYDDENTLTVVPTYQKRAYILLRAEDDAGAVDAATGITVSTTDAATAASLNGILRPWLAGNQGIELLGEATAATYFS
jgi:hypothetical protein